MAGVEIITVEGSRASSIIIITSSTAKRWGFGDFSKEKDLLAFLIDGDYRLPYWMDRLAERQGNIIGVGHCGLGH